MFRFHPGEPAHFRRSSSTGSPSRTVDGCCRGWGEVIPCCTRSCRPLRESSPAHPALSHGDDTWTYAELWHAVGAVAAGLRRDGLRRGDRVAVYLDKRLETVAAMFGTSCASGVFVPVNPVLRAAQVGHILRDARCRVLVTTAERYASLKRSSAPATRSRSWCWSGPTRRRRPTPHTGSGPGPAGGRQRLAAAGTRRTGHRRRRRRDPLHVRQHRAAQGRGAEPPQPAGRRRQRQRVPREHRRRRHPRRPAAQLRRGPQPADDRRSPSGRTSCCTTTCCPATSSRPARRHGVTGLTGVPPLWIQIAEQEWPAEATRVAALLRQHRRPDAAAAPDAAARALPAARPSSCTA